MKAAVKHAQKLDSFFIVIFVGILVLLPVHAFLSTWLGTSIGPLLVWKSWKEILLLALVPLAVAYWFARPDVAKAIWSRLVNKLVAAYAALHLLIALLSQVTANALIAGLLMNLRFFAMFILAQMIVASGHPWIERIKRLVPIWLLWTAIGLSVFALLQVTVLPKDFLAAFGYDKFQTIAPFTLLDDNPNALRAFATMRGPNELGAWLLIPLAFALYFLLKRQRLVLSGSAFTAGLLALIASGSRSAWIGFIVLVVVMGLFMVPRPKLKRWLKLGAAPVILLLAVFLWAAVTVPALRLAVFHSSPGDPSLFEGSTDTHWQATARGAQELLTHPFGQGPGSAGPASYYGATPNISENYFVQIGQEVGWLGLALFVAISVLVVRGLYRSGAIEGRLLLASFSGISVICLFLHGWADDPTAMTWWGLAGLYISAKAPEKKGKRS